MDTKGIDTGGAWLLGDQDPGSWGEDAWLETWTVQERASWWWKGRSAPGSPAPRDWDQTRLTERWSPQGQGEARGISIQYDVFGKENKFLWMTKINLMPPWVWWANLHPTSSPWSCLLFSISREGPWDTEQGWNMGGRAVDMAEAGLYRPELRFQGNWGMLLTQKTLVHPHGPHGTVSPVLYTPWKPSEDQGWHSVQ